MDLKAGGFQCGNHCGLCGFARLFGVSLEEFGELGKYSEYIFLLLGNAVFVLYDIAVSRSAAVYMNMLHPRVQRILKGR